MNDERVCSVCAQWRGEAERLQKLFDDAGEGQYNVLNLVENYQQNSIDADERLRAVRRLIEENGCECGTCLACRITMVLP